jgi:hypothetical protein
LFPPISLILNRKASRQHSPLSGALLHSKDFALHFNGKPSDLIGDSFEINFEYNTRTRWWAGWGKNKRAVFTDITTTAFTLSRLPVPIRPPERNCCLQQEPERLSRWPLKTQQAPPTISLVAH